MSKHSMTLSFVFLLLASSSSAAPNDVCRAREQRCEQRCSTKNQVGSMNHLKCNDECRAEETFCRREGAVSWTSH